MTDDDGFGGRVGELAKRAGSPSLIGAAVGAAAAAVLAKRGTHAPARDDEPPAPEDTETEQDDAGADEDDTGSDEDPEFAEDDAPETGSPATGDIRAQLLEELLERFAEGSGYFDVAQMDRLERLIRTREELESYVAVLAQRVRREPATDHIFIRLERLLSLLSD